MENSLAAQESIDVIESVLQGTKYHDLKETLTNYGMGEVWKAGQKKDVMIAKAMEAVAVFKAIRSDLAEDKAPELPKEDKEDIIPEKGAESEANAPQIVDKPVLSKETMEFNLKMVRANLKNGIAGQRAILLKKQDEYMEMLGLTE